MASPMVTSPSARPLDPHKQGRFSLRLGNGITQPSRPTDKFSSVKFNHKPNTSDSSRETALSSVDNERYNLTITDSNGTAPGKYKYSGQRKNLKRSYVLIFDQEKQSCTLQPLSSSYTFNLQSTPWEKSASQLAKQYKQLRPKEDAAEPADSLFDEDDAGSASEPDDGNPFDYRHFLQGGRESARSPFPEATLASATNTPHSAGRPTSLSQLQRQSGTLKKQATPKASLQTIDRKRKASPPPTSRAKAPTVRLDRRASHRPTDPKPAKKPAKAAAPKAAKVKSAEFVDSSDDEDDIPQEPPVKQRRSPSPPSDVDAEGEDEEVEDAGGLEIDFGGSTPPGMKKRHGLAPPHSGGGPISLRSAANSPGSRVSTPLHSGRWKPEDDGLVLEFGDGDAEGEEDEEDEEVVADGESDGNADIEPISLGPPAHEQRSSLSAAPQEDEDDEDGYASLEAELMQGMAEQEEEGDDPVLQYEEDESDVSEAE